MLETICPMTCWYFIWVLFKVIVYFPNRKSTMTGESIQWRFVIFWKPLKQIQDILGWKSHLMNTHGGETMLPIISRHMHIPNRMIEHLQHPILSENMPSMSSTLGHIPNILNITNICQSFHGLCQPTSRILLHQIRFNLDELSRAFQA